MADLNGVEIAKGFITKVCQQYDIDATTALHGLLNGFKTNINGKDVDIPAITNKPSVAFLTEAHKQLSNKTLF